jgi:hypothetical protein
MSLEEKLNQLRTLLAKRDDIDRQLEAIIGHYGATPPADRSDTVADKLNREALSGYAPKNDRKGKAKRVKGTRVCKVCGKPGHMAKTCPTARGAAPIPRTEPKSRRLTEDQFDQLKHLQAIGDLSSHEFAAESGTALSEVNRAITSRSYEEYCDF